MKKERERANGDVENMRGRQRTTTIGATLAAAVAEKQDVTAQKFVFFFVDILDMCFILMGRLLALDDHFTLHMYAKIM